MSAPNWTLVALGILIASVAGAQKRPKVELADSDYVAQNVSHLLFDGIRLSDDQVVRAKAIIKEAFRAQFALRTGTVAEQVKKGDEANAQRDSFLKSLLKSGQDRDLFDRNLAAMNSGRTPSRQSTKGTPPHSPDGGVRPR
jgi:hypothetical protein